jgi:4-hydroxybenzoate polyprenyltransferase
MIIGSRLNSSVLTSTIKGQKHGLRSSLCWWIRTRSVSTESTEKPLSLTYPQRLVNSLPANIKPYAELMRVDRPGGMWYLYSPCTWSITMAAYGSAAPLGHTLWTLSLFGLGAFIMRSAGCTINDILDRNYDNKVERTKLRPIASGQVSVPNAVAFLGAQCFAGLGVLLALPTDCFWLGALSLPFVFSYPLFKRITYYPQIVFSITFTWGALLGFPAMGMWNIPAMLALQASTFFWGIIYDTIYAHQDKVWDVKAGVKSTALKWGDRTKTIISRLAVGQIGFLAASGYLASMGPCFYLGTAWAAYRLFDMIRQVDLDDPKDCWNWFMKNITTGHVIWLGAAGDYLLKLLTIL